MMRLFTFGGLTVQKDSGGDSAIGLAHVKRNALLADLAVERAGGPHSRDTLLALFWPESDERHARDALKQLLQSLRRDLGDGVFATGNGNSVVLDRDVFWCDAVDFERLLDEGQEEHALALYRGALLEGFHLSGCLAFERWLEDERRRLERRAAAATWLLAEQALAEGRTVQAADWGLGAGGNRSTIPASVVSRCLGRCPPTTKACCSASSSCWTAWAIGPGRSGSTRGSRSVCKKTMTLHRHPRRRN